MPPPVTPSPHRFLAPREPRNAKPSTLSQTHRFAPKGTPEQSIPAHRFALAAQPTGDGERGATTSTQREHTQTPKSTRKLMRVESIHDASQETAGQEDGDRHDVMDSAFQDEDEDDTELLFGPTLAKRRRLSPQTSIEDAASTPAAHPPSTPAPASYRFLFQRTPVRSTQQYTDQPATRPSFLLPSHQSSSPPMHPLPETFSPQRRGQRFIPGGLASTVRNWVMEVAQTAAQSTHSTSYSKPSAEDAYRIKLRVSDVISGDTSAGHGFHEVCSVNGGMLVVHGIFELGRESGTGTDARAMLAGQSARKSAAPRLKLGDIVGIRAPWWDVDIKGKKWIVGADWAVL